MPALIIIAFLVMLFFMVTEPAGNREKRFLFHACKDLMIQVKPMPDHCTKMFNDLADKK